jgi:two-component system sensor histidine kinase KdpD
LTRQIQHQTTALYILSRQLTHTRGVSALVSLGAQYIADVFKAEVVVFLFKRNRLSIHCSYPPKQKINTKERSIAEWVFEMGLSAGLGTDTLSFSKALYLPLVAATGPIGVLRVQPKNQPIFTPEERDLLDSCIHQISLALEVDRLYEKTKRKELKLKTEQARISVLGAISKDLRASLKIIGTGITSLKKSNAGKIGTVGKEIDDEIEKLSKLNNNIMRMIQLDGAYFQL